MQQDWQSIIAMVGGVAQLASAACAVVSRIATWRKPSRVGPPHPEVSSRSRASGRVEP